MPEQDSIDNDDCVHADVYLSMQGSMICNDCPTAISYPSAPTNGNNR